MKKRVYRAAAAQERCKQDHKLRGDGKNEGAQCMRKAVINGLCRQHAKMAGLIK